MVNKIFNLFSVVFGCMGGVLVFLLGGFDFAAKSLIALMVLDFITGILKGIYKKELSSVIGYKGIIKKVFILIVVAVSVIVQEVINVPFREVVIMFFFTNEAISILENVSDVIHVPEKLKNVLKQIRSENLKQEEGEEDDI